VLSPAEMNSQTSPPPYLWRSALLALTLALAAGAALAVAIGSGWHAPHPPSPPAAQQAGPLSLQVTQPHTQTLLLLGDVGETFAFEATAIPLQSSRRSGYGLAFGCRADRCTVFAVDTDGYIAVLQLDGGQETPLVDWQLFPHIRRGQAANRLRLACADASCHGWINDEYAVTFVWPEGGGELGLWGCRLEGVQVDFAFQDLKIWHE